MLDPTAPECILSPMDPKNRQGTAGKRVVLAVGVGVVVLIAAFLAGAGWTVALSLSWMEPSIAGLVNSLAALGVR